MKHSIRVALLLIVTNTAFGQGYVKDTVIYRKICNCDSIEQNDTLRCIDKFGKKQGYWKYYRDKIHINWISKDLRNIQKITEPIVYGFYKDGVKIGKWDYFQLSNLDYFGELLISPVYSITYYPDGSKEIEKRLGNYILRFNGDSSVISGRITILRPDNSKDFSVETGPKIDSYVIYIDSKIIESIVYLIFKYKNKVIVECKREDLADIIYDLDNGFYDNKIKN